MSNHAPSVSSSVSTSIALITGSSRGIGKSTALALADRGVDVLVTYASAEAEAAEVVRAIQAKGRRAAALRLDLADTRSFAAFANDVRRALSSFGGRETFDFLVHNAGVGGGGSVAETTEATFDSLVAVHMKGPLFLTQALLPLLADGGRIVTVTTGLTRYHHAGTAVYSAVKSATEVISRHLAVELGPRGITVNSVAPGGIATDFGGGLLRAEAVQRAVAAETPLGRMGQPEDVADVIATLLSPAARWISGQRIEVTGGYRL